MLAMALRQARRGGAEIVVVDPRPVRLPFDFRHVPAHPDELSGVLSRVLKQAVSGMDTTPLDPKAAAWLARLPAGGKGHEAAVARIAEGLARSRRPAILCGTHVAGEDAVQLAADAALLLAALKDRSGVLFLLPGANAAGAALATQDVAGFDGIVAGIEAGAIRALVLVETDPYRWFRDPDRLDRALDALDVLVVTDYLDTPSMRRADIFVPALTVFECGGLFVNPEGRVQRAAPVFAGGRPIAQTGGGDHPPRAFRLDIPDGDGMPAREFAAALGGHEAGSGPPEAKTVLAGLPEPERFPAEGFRLDPVNPAAGRFDRVPSEAGPTRARKLVVLTAEETFGTERLSERSPCLESATPEPRLTLHPEDAAELGLDPGDAALLDAGGETFSVPVHLDAGTARGVLILPRHARIPWRRFGPGAASVDRGRIRKAKGGAAC